MDPNAPVIGNARLSFQGACTIAGTNALGTRETIVIDYSDADGNVRGGTVEATAAFAGGTTVNFTVPIPSPAVSITGTTSGTITLVACLRFGGASSVRETIRIIDASGKSSNLLVTDVRNPGGALLLPHDADPTPRKSLDLGQ